MSVCLRTLHPPCATMNCDPWFPCLRDGVCWSGNNRDVDEACRMMRGGRKALDLHGLMAPGGSTRVPMDASSRACSETLRTRHGRNDPISGGPREAILNRPTPSTSADLPSDLTQREQPRGPRSFLRRLRRKSAHNFVDPTPEQRIVTKRFRFRRCCGPSEKSHPQGHRFEPSIAQ